MSWIYLFLAGVLEVGWALGLKRSEGFSKPLPTLITLALMALSFTFLALALRKLPIGTAYAIWTGIGAVGTALFGIAWFGESRDLPKLLCLTLIVAGIVGLKLTSK